MKPDQVATWSKLTGVVKVHRQGCQAARATKLLVLCDADEVADLLERGFTLKVCPCTVSG